MGRTGGFAGGGPLFGYAEGPGDSLRILFEYRLAEIKQFVVFVGTGNRTDLRALAAARAFGHVHISGCLVNFCGKISGLAIDAQQLGIR
jgi:nicotinamidase-related amidase